MTNKIYPCLWADGNAKQMAELYIKAFGNGSITVDSGMVVDFELFGQRFMALNGGPMYTKNPSISFFVTFENEADITAAWNALAEGGNALMPFNTYPWAAKYGWVQDKFGASWQLSMSDNHKLPQRITPAFLFVGAQVGNAQKAIDAYTAIFPNSTTDMIARYEAGEGDKEGFIKHGRFTLSGQGFIAMDSSADHKFQFSEGISLVVSCDGQEAVDYYWDKLVAGGTESMCGWLKDQFGVSWQIVPVQLLAALGDADPEKAKYAMDAMLQMHKIEIVKLTKA